MNVEIEARLLDCNVSEIIEKLKRLGAKFIGDWLQIRNCYDFNPKKENSWIRLRTNGFETTLTIKEIQTSKIDGTKECEVVVSDFNKTDEILNKLGYIARTKQENRRIRFVLDEVEVDIDFWPMIPAYVEFEADSEDKIKNICKKLNIDFNDLVSLDVERVYNKYGININDFAMLELDEKTKLQKFDL